MLSAPCFTLGEESFFLLESFSTRMQVVERRLDDVIHPLQPDPLEPLSPAL